MRKSLLALVGLTVAVTLAMAAAPSPADACECVDSAPRILLPRDGATAVPTNTRVLVTAEQVGMDRWAGTDTTRTPSLGLVPVNKKKQQGAPVKAMVTIMMSEAWGTVYVVTPAKPLKAKTAYQLVVLGPKGKAAAKDRKPVSSFTTGAGADTKAPLFTGIDRFTAVVEYRAATGSKCDGQPPFEQLSWKYDAATDEGSEARDLIRILYVQKKGEPRTVKLIEPLDTAKPVTAVDDTTCAPFRQIMKVNDEVCAAIEVVDLAGNVAGASVEKCMVAKKM